MKLVSHQPSLVGTDRVQAGQKHSDTRRLLLTLGAQYVLPCPACSPRPSVEVSSPSASNSDALNELPTPIGSGQHVAGLTPSHGRWSH